MTETKQKLPNWFKGSLYNTGESVENPFSGEVYELNNVELSMYDFLTGCSILFSKSSNRVNDEMINDYQKGLRWFRQNNPEAYMALLD
tara:strand:+ start:110 stop:373 length:264 start_codon:yes stop_codon:yes gene_type:complete